MVNPQLLDYVKSQIAQGVNSDTIRQNLISGGGWHVSDIDEAFKVIAPVSGSNTQNPAGVVPASIKYAGFWMRWVALILDGIILAVPGIIVQLLVAFTLAAYGFSANSGQIIASLSYLVLYFAYFVLMTYYNGATLGKMIVGIKVQSESGQKLSVGQVVLRETIGKIISGLIISIGYMMAGFTDRKRALHDMMAKTVVVYKDPTKSHTAGLVVGIILACILPVLAIIGILSSIVLVSLNVARQKGFDAQTKSALSQMRTEAEVYYGQNNNSYSVARDCSSGMFVDPSFASIKSGIKSTTVLTCYAEKSSYAVSASLAPGGQNYCVDSTAYNGYGTAVDNGSNASCQDRPTPGVNSNTL
jgi:uncharacterized RDD family membrane protein YckC/type II secretory pathway pseudopilin PulG